MPSMDGARPEFDVDVVDIRVGEGPEVGPGSRVRLHYTTALVGGAVIDSSRGRERPLTARLGEHALCRGLERGLVGMRAGGSRRITVPPPLGYGPRGLGEVVPPLTDVVFEVELYEVDGVGAPAPTDSVAPVDA